MRPPHPPPRRLQLLSGIVLYVRSSGEGHPILVDSQYSVFTVVVQSYEARRITLKVSAGMLWGSHSR